jgi:hypothetical protein
MFFRKKGGRVQKNGIAKGKKKARGYATTGNTN